MKKTLLFLLFFLSSIYLNAQTWNVVSRFPEQGISSVNVTDSLHLRGISYSPWQFIYSDDGGLTWSVIISNDTLQRLSFTDAMHGWASTYHGKMLHTIDGGHTWNSSQINTQQYFDLMQFVTDSTGFVFTGQSDSLFVTHDAGGSWNYYKTNLPWGSYQKQIFFKDELNGWFINGLYDTRIYHTVDGGAHWTADSLPSPMGGYLNNGISFIDSMNGFLQGSSSLMRTNDGGITWTIVSNNNGGDVAFRDSLDGVRVDYSENIFHTHDGGSNWDSVYSTPLKISNSNPPHIFISDGIFYEFNNSGSLLKSTDGINWKYVAWNTFPLSYGNSVNPQMSMSSSANGMFVSASDCTNNSCGNETFSTNDSGRTWHRNANSFWNTAVQTYSDTAWYFTQTFFSVDSCILYRSSDQLHSYIPFYSFNDRIQMIYFIDSLHVIALGDSVHLSDDGGITWTTSGGIYPPIKVQFPDAQHGWSISGNQLAKTTDYGHTWNIIYTDPTFSNNFWKVMFTDTLHGYIINRYSTQIEKSYDGGYNWTILTAPSWVNDIFMADSLKGWIATENGIYFTDDGFLTFQLQYNKPVKGLSFIDRSHGFAFTENLFLSTDQTSLINGIPPPHENQIGAMKIFPNPAGAIVEILLDGEKSFIVINDMTGKDIYSITTLEKSVTIDTEGIKPGVYVLVITNKLGSISRKLVVGN